MKQLFKITGQVHLTTWLGLVLTAVGVAFVTLISLGVLDENHTSAQQITRMSKLAEPAEIVEPRRIYDVTSVAGFLKQREEQRKIAEAEAEQRRIAAEAAAKARNTVKTKTTSHNVSSAKATPVQNRPQQTPAAQPSYDRIVIPKIGLNTRLATVGLTSNGAVGVSPNLPAWFNQSSQPGTRNGKYAATFIDGHSNGIFRNLGALAVGDTVTVSVGGSGEYTYQVVKIETRAVNDPSLMRDALKVAAGGSQGLNLMTCAGNYDAALGTSESRLVVYAVR